MVARVAHRTAIVLLALGIWLAAAGPAPAADNDDPAPASAPADPDPWPRDLLVASGKVTLYQPQAESWQDGLIALRAAVASTPTGSKDRTFGVVWLEAVTRVDRVERSVTLTGFQVSRTDFPTRKDKGKALGQEIESQLHRSTQTLSLDRLEASLAAARALPLHGVKVRNEPPAIFVSDSPAILVRIEGEPVWRKVADTSLERVLDTRAALLREEGRNPLYLHVYDGWLTAAELAGPWLAAVAPPKELQAVAERLAKEGRVDLVSGAGTKPPPSLAKGVPRIFVSQKPAELIVFHGKPDLEPIDGTSLSWASNTASDVIVDTRNNAWYVLLAGRWFEAKGLEGPWTYVASAALPADFRKIPPASPAGLVLASVAGTPQAREAVIESSIPQTAVVPLTGGPSFTAHYDGKPQLRPIPGTTLQYVVNSETPVIRVDTSSWYAVHAGVWFTSLRAEGPWSVATSVPDAIYQIPPSSPLHYVTYVRIYETKDDEVVVGYTPGYLGTVVTSDGVVVYGTGYDYAPWIGDVFYAPPPTWDVMAQPVYNPEVGWSYGFALGMTTAAMMYDWDAPVYYTTYYHGYGCCGSTSANVYRHWGDTVTSGTRTWYSNPNGTVGSSAKGSYTNYRTGTKGTYSASRSVNPYTGQAQRGYHRSFDTAPGTTGNVSRQAGYDAQTGKRSYESSMSAEGKGGSSVTRNVEAKAGPGAVSVDRTTTVTNGQTGESHTFQSGTGNNDHYAGADGHVYRSDGNGGWQRQTADGGWQRATGDTGWADREQQARVQGQNRWDGMRAGGFGEGGFDRGGLGGGGFGGGGFGGRFGGGGFGGRFGGGGFGGGGFGGRRR